MSLIRARRGETRRGVRVKAGRTSVRGLRPSGGIAALGSDRRCSRVALVGVGRASGVEGHLFGQDSEACFRFTLALAGARGFLKAHAMTESGIDEEVTPSCVPSQTFVFAFSGSASAGGHRRNEDLAS